jgi:hypothetical protein
MVETTRAKRVRLFIKEDYKSWPCSLLAFRNHTLNVKRHHVVINADFLAWTIFSINDVMFTVNRLIPWSIEDEGRFHFSETWRLSCCLNRFYTYYATSTSIINDIGTTLVPFNLFNPLGAGTAGLVSMTN